MGAKIYDSTQAAFVDAEPKIYVGSAFADSKGMSYNGSEWVEDWGSNIIEFKSESDFNQFQIVSPGVGTRSWNSTYGFTSTITTPTDTTNSWRNLNYKYMLSHDIDIAEGLEISAEIRIPSAANNYRGSVSIKLYDGSTQMVYIKLKDTWTSASRLNIEGNLRGYIVDYGSISSEGPTIYPGSYIMTAKVNASAIAMYYNNNYIGQGGAVSGSFDNVVISFSYYESDPYLQGYINNIYIGPERS